MQPGDTAPGRSGPDGGACSGVVGTEFIRRPSVVEEEAWSEVCAGCCAFVDCGDWADRMNVRGVYAAGLWRE